jgi:hypothetical protein
MCPANPTTEWFACQSNLDSTTVAYLMDNIHDQRTLGTESISVFRPVSGTPPVTYQVRIVAYPIQIRWKAEDFVVTSTSTAAIANKTGNSNSSSSGLSAGAKGGIAVAATVFGLLILALISYRWFKGRKGNRAEDIAAPNPTVNSMYQKAELDAAETQRKPIELPSHQNMVRPEK